MSGDKRIARSSGTPSQEGNAAGLRRRLLRLLDIFPSRRLAVIGDLIADEFLYGQIARVSREAPVLVLQYQDLVRVPGGAANAANNLLDLGCGTKIVGIVGRDEAGAALVKQLRGKGADLRFLSSGKRYCTPVKTRILAGAHHSAPQQVVRVDRVWEPQVSFRRPWSRVFQAMEPLHGVILSDYGYGAADPEAAETLGRFSSRRKIPIVVDSRFRMSQFRGVTSITPNITELEAATGRRIGSDAALLHRTSRAILRRQRLDSLLVTQGRFGMTLFQQRRKPIHIPIFGSDEVADVTGAGDTVIAVFTLALACGASPEDAARLANYAGGLVVMKRGTATVTREELRKAITSDLPERPATQ
jgi:rfaE bifunctional protein kinase chain/domain